MHTNLKQPYNPAPIEYSGCRLYNVHIGENHRRMPIMVETTLLQLTVFSLGATSFAASLVILTVVLSAMRFRRLARLDYALYVPASSGGLRPINVVKADNGHERPTKPVRPGTASTVETKVR